MTKMRALATILAVGTVMGQALPAQDYVRPTLIEGRVVDASTGAPLRKTSITLRPASPSPGQAGGPQAQARRQQSVTTDANGRFAFTVEQPGVFRIGADHTGYVRGEYGSVRPGGQGKSVTVTAGQQLTGLEIKLTPHGVIAGRVVDEDGDPVERAQVTVTPRLGTPGQRSSTVLTNDLGEFRAAGLAAGKYYVMAQRIGVVVADGDDSGQEVYTITYFPGTTDASAAAPISITPGQQVTGIFVPLRKGRVFRVSGSISGSVGDEAAQPQAVGRAIDGQPVPLPRVRAAGGANRVVVNLVERGSGVSSRGGRRTMGSRITGGDGSFEVVNVPPGSYWAVAVLQQRGAVIVGRTAVEVRNGNVGGVVVPVGPPVTVTGVARGESRDTVTLTNARITLVTMDDGPQNSATGQVQANGSFQISNAGRARYRVTAGGLPDGVYLKSVRVNGQDVTKAGLDLTNAAANMAVELVLSTKAASVAAAVKLGEGSLPGRALLVADPYNEDEPPMAPVGVPVVVSDAGAVNFKNVPPGSYRVYAFEDVDTQAIDAELLKRLESYSEKVSVAEGASARVELRQVPAGETMGQ